ncbi:MAG: DUF3592 domain-containing protein [Akkermansia sp.]|nr:DUF3592 domain-containing protein [Akkermansia sp.]
MSLSEWGLNNRDAERLQQVLQDDERVVMVAAPRRQMPLSESFGPVLLGLVLLAFSGGAAYLFGKMWWVAVLCFSPFWLLALVFLSVPLRYSWRMARTLYVLTDKRAIVLEQLSLWRRRCVCWPLFPGLVKKVAKEGHDLGSLIFDYEMHFSFESRRRRYVPRPVGFLMVPQPERVQQLVAEQVAAIPADQAPFAYRPPVLKTPAPKLDAWGTPLAEQPWDKKNDRRFFLIFGAVFVFFGLLGLGQGVLRLHTESRLEAEGVQATATVLKVWTSGSSGRGHSESYYPTLRFTDAAGRVQTVDYHIGTDNYPVGCKLPIIYLPTDPESLRIEEPGLSPGVVSVLGGVIFAFVGGGILIFGYRMKKKS